MANRSQAHFPLGPIFLSLYGDEVNRPAWLKIAPAKTRRFLERDPDHEAHEADRLRRECFTREFDRQPIWISGKLNPIFNEPEA